MDDKKKRLKEFARRNPEAARAVVIGAVSVMTDGQRVAQLRAHGHDAHVLPDRRIVLKLHGRWYRVAGGDFVHPSIIEIPGFSGLKE